jgi:hypothetical protein
MAEGGHAGFEQLTVSNEFPMQFELSTGTPFGP